MHELTIHRNDSEQAQILTKKFKRKLNKKCKITLNHPISEHSVDNRKLLTSTKLDNLTMPITKLEPPNLLNCSEAITN